jgi:hypothetical protein
MLIARQEELIAHSSVRRDEKIARKRDSVEHLVIGRNIRVEDAEVTDDLAAYIREHRKLNLVSLAKAAQYLARIVSYTRGVDSLAFELGERLLQLDELVTAVGSPSGAATKDQQQSIWPRKIAERSHRSILIWQAEIRHFLANLRSGLIPVVLRLGEFEPGRGRNLGAAGAHLLDYIVQDCGFGLRFHF